MAVFNHVNITSTSIYVLFCDSTGGGVGIHADDRGDAGGNAGIDAG